MKNLVAKAGVAAVTSVLLTSVISAPEAQAIELTPSNQATLRNGTTNGSGPLEVGYLEISNDNGFADAGVVEAGEFLFNESRGFVEYDLSEYFNNSGFINDFTLSFNVFDKGGSGSGGTAGAGDNLGNPFEGIVDVIPYFGTALLESPLTPLFEPNPIGGNTDPFFGGISYSNPLLSIDMSQKKAGDRISIDVTGLVRDLLFASGETSFGIMLKANIDNPGACGPAGADVCRGVTFNNFGIEAVPTPAAILPSLFGLASAAFRKKQKDEDGINPENA